MDFIACLEGDPLFVPVRAHSNADGEVLFAGEDADVGRALFAFFEGHEITLSFACFVFAGRNIGNGISVVGEEHDVFGDWVGNGILFEVDRVELAVSECPELGGRVICDLDVLEVAVEFAGKIEAVFGVLEVEEVPSGWLVFAYPASEELAAVFVPGRNFNIAGAGVGATCVQEIGERERVAFEFLVLNINASEIIGVLLGEN